MSAASQLAIGHARRTVVQGGDHELAALQSGPPGGPPVLLLPGYTGSKEDFGPILDPLGDAGFHVTAIDLPGQFESPPLPRPTEYAPDRLGAIVRAVAAGLGPDVRLLGHSFGGLVARSAVIGGPGGFGSLVLLSSGPAQLGGARRLVMDEMEPVLADAGVTGLYAALQLVAEGDPAYVVPPPEVAEFLQQRFLAGSPEMLQGMADALRGEPDRVAELAAAARPVLVAHGADDDAWPPTEQRDMAQRLGARYEVIPDAAHSPAVENPAATVAVLADFWRG